MAQCSDPTCSIHQHGIDGVLAKVRRDIKNTGWSVIGITGQPSFAYTVGLTDQRLPELYFELSGPGTRQTLTNVQAALNAVGHYLTHHPKQARHGATIPIETKDHATITYRLEACLTPAALSIGVARRMYRSVRILVVSVVG